MDGPFARDETHSCRLIGASVTRLLFSWFSDIKLPFLPLVELEPPVFGMDPKIYIMSPSWNTDRGGESGRKFRNRFYVDVLNEFLKDIATKQLRYILIHLTLPDPKGGELISTIVYPGKILDHGCSGTNVQIVRYMSDLGRKTHRTA